MQEMTRTGAIHAMIRFELKSFSIARRLVSKAYKRSNFIYIYIYMIVILDPLLYEEVFYVYVFM